MPRIAHAVALSAVLAFNLLFASAASADAALDAFASEIVAATTSEDRASIDAKYEPELATKIKEAAEDSEGSILDFDWMTNSQDPDVEGIKSTIKSTVTPNSETEAVIRVTFAQGENKSVIDYHVRKTGGAWMIHDVVYPDGDFGLRNELKMD